MPIRPTRVERVADGLRWSVSEVLAVQDGGEHAGRTVREAYTLQVWGPLPGDPGHHGLFALRAVTYAGTPYWWIEPIPATGPDEPARPTTTSGQGP